MRLSLADPPEPQAGPAPQPSPLTPQPSAPSWDVFARGGGRVVVFATAPETHHAYPDTIGDMLMIAEHQGWKSLRVEGEEAFRRDVWIQARAKDVAGARLPRAPYEPVR